MLLSCDQTAINQSKKLDITFDKKYKNSGFSLIYNDDLKIKKIDQRSLKIFHKNLKRKSNVKITNPLNGKSLIAEVKSNRVKFSPFYNSIITQRIAEELELDLKEPYIDIVLISKSSTYIAKKTKTFEEEKTVAEKAPIDGIKISDLNSSNKTKKKLQRAIDLWCKNKDAALNKYGHISLWNTSLITDMINLLICESINLFSC